MKIRIATYNVENLFRRAAILNIQDQALVDDLLEKVKRLQFLISETTYTDQIKDEVFEITHQLLKYVDLRRDGGTLGDWKKEGEYTGFRINKSCKGRADWLGELTFKGKDFSDQQRKNTGKVIKSLNADILCLVEVEGMAVLKAFNSQVLGTKKFAQYTMIDSPNDPRGIDLACLTRHKIVALKTHVFDAGKRFNPVFSRDCLEVAIDVGAAEPIFVLCNHFKSQGGKTQEERDDAAAKRFEQSTRVAEILAGYDLQRQNVVVLGDLNEDSINAYASLTPLFNVPDLHPVIDPALPPEERFTYYYGGAKKGERLNQLDYIFLSKPLALKMTAHGIERRGIFDLEKITAKEGAPSQVAFPEIDSWSSAASDHAAVWVELDIS